MVQGVKDAASYQTLQKKTEAVIKSTGNAAGISVEGVQELAGSLESLSGVDEEEIINSQNVLATFTKIKNAGPNKVFDDATEAALNMSVALGQDLQGATTLVGKALNDPIKGLSALGRAGVQFTDQQKEQIKAMVEAGDVAGAQTMILGELETQFGGAAEAAGSGFAGSMARLQDALGDAFREIGTQLLPILTDLAEWLAKNLPGAIEDFKRGLSIVSDFIDRNVIPVLSDIWRVISEDVIPVLAALARFFIEEVMPKIATVVRFIVDDVVPTIASIATTVAEIATTIGGKIGAIWGFFTDLQSKIGGIASALWDPLRSAFVGVVNGILGAWNALDIGVGPWSIPDWVPVVGGKTFHIADVFPDIPLIGNTGTSAGLGQTFRMHTGGMVTARGIAPLRSDEVMAKLQLGETVVPKTGLPGGRRGDVIFQIEEARHYDEDALLRAAAARLAGVR